eukprot:Colp12_sorted_trinity150504_noHs@32592
MLSLLVRRLASPRQLQLFAIRKTLAPFPCLLQETSALRVRPLATLNRPSLAARAAEFPEAIRQWHPLKNTIGPADVAPFRKKKIWFICDEGHEWEGVLCNRTKNHSGCPTCNHKKVTSSNTLLAKFPAVADEWHPTKNGGVTPKDVSYGSRAKVWWLCKEGHEWESMVASRTTGQSGCQKCFGERRKGLTRGAFSLPAAYPDLAQQWHPSKNGELTADTVSYGSNKKVWWQCGTNPTHEWEAQVRTRTIQKTGCPFCKSGPRPLSKTNNLLSLYPEVACEWHQYLNGELTADKVTGKNCRKVWWACKGCGHEWQAQVRKRTVVGHGCPKCARMRKRKHT